MAEAFYDEDGPMAGYLRDAGEGGMPGDYVAQEEDEGDESGCGMVSGYVAMLVQSFLPSISRTPFVERFKYDIISSNLLSTALSAHTPYPKSPTFPGTIATPSETSPVRRRRSSGGASGRPKQDEENAGYWVWAVALVLLCAGYFILGLAACGLAWMTAVETGATEDMQDSMDALKDLVCAGESWDSVVHEALGILEKDEATPLSNPPSANPYPTSPGITRSRSSTANNTPLRVALQSTLHTTQTACDNIRPLFAALTSPDDLRQLSEMYAPASPQRPVSLPTSARKTAMEDKRATWGGKRSTWYGTPNGKRRSELTSFLGPSHSPSRSAPVTPLQEEEESDDPLQDIRKHGEVFGLDALDLQRRRRVSSQLSPMSPNFIQPPRLSALQATLSAALSAKRYTAAHLLALRFTDEGLQDYWEDVRSVMSLLTGALADAAARLGEAISEHEQGQEELGRPSTHSREVSRLWAAGRIDLTPPNLTLELDLGEMDGYAPMPGRMARFGLHIEKLREAMRAAGGELEGVVGALKGHRRVHSDASDSSSSPLLNHEPDTAEPLQAYDRLRRELGVALRECERGRACLVEALVPPSLSSSSSRPSSLGSAPSLDNGPVSEESSLEHELEEVLVSTGIEHPVLLPREEEMELGIEEVYEYDLGLEKPTWTRERSTMPREERIRAAKESREMERETRKPLEVVEELKDVIFRVREERERRQLGVHQPSVEMEEEEEPATLAYEEEATLAYVDDEEEDRTVHAEIGVAL